MAKKGLVNIVTGVFLAIQLAMYLGTKFSYLWIAWVVLWETPLWYMQHLLRTIRYGAEIIPDILDTYCQVTESSPGKNPYSVA